MCLSIRKISFIAAAGLLLLGALTGAEWLESSEKPQLLTVAAAPDHLEADGHETSILSIKSSQSVPPTISFESNALGASVDGIVHHVDEWNARIRAGIVPGRIVVRVESAGYRAARAVIDTTLDGTDTAGDGTPDLLRFDDEPDEQAFRKWFVWLAEAQYFLPAEARRPEVNDCAALIRFAYREALRPHNGAWTQTIALPEYPAFDSPQKYQYPATPLGSALFRVRPGPFRASDLNEGAFRQFADAETLWRFNSHLVSRDISRALPGDLLFFRRQSNPVTFHGMIYVGASKVRPDGRRYLVYHTGPTGSDAGEIRRPAVEELMRFPQAEWRPVPSNPSFLGVMRWNILRRQEDDFEARMQ